MEFLNWCAAHKTELIIAAAAVVLIIIICTVIFIHKRKKGLFKFRRYKKFEGPPDNKQQHPKLIVEVTDEEYGFMGLTESAKHGKANNLPIKNPKKRDKRASYIRKEVRYDSKDNFFVEILKNYKLTRKDKKAIIRYLNNRKKK